MSVTRLKNNCTISIIMHKELDFFITERPVSVQRWAEAKQASGAIVVHSYEEMLNKINGLTKPRDSVLRSVD